ncbi:MAG: RdgB/HAM1 family non-canonical purine NTP pyrophosphatase [Myxococcota bacterium]|nr:RdgB/HAM1 family non-canonical purine NTP pyrophosphatase [Myxococcota bacterium]
MRIALATGNAGKVEEFRSLLRDQPFELVGLEQLGPVDFPDEGDEYAPNAVTKALVVARAHGLPALADDSGIEVAALGGRPGPHSARYGGEGLDAAGRVAKLLAEVGDASDRRARFVCWAALALPSGVVELRAGFCTGHILHQPTGGGGFGYDPIFGIEGSSRAMAELAEEEKNEISHRGRALRALAPALLRRVAGHEATRVG